MKELKDFLKELEEGITTTEVGDFVTKEWAARLISEAYIAGMNFQEAQKKGASNGGIQSKG